MDQDEQARRQIEQDLVEIGENAGMVDSRCIADWYEVGAVYRDAQDGQHTFTFPPVGSDTVLTLDQ